jgi:3-phenylpropionate/cinnamic acid dioxygenase small subunit
LFADATLADEAGQVFATGADEIQTRWQFQTILYDGSPRTRHVTANPVIQVDGDTAHCSSSYIVFQGTDDLPLQPIVTGRYADTFACGANGWHFTQRRYAIDHVGDLSHHLRS